MDERCDLERGSRSLAASGGKYGGTGEHRVHTTANKHGPRNSGDDARIYPGTNADAAAGNACKYGDERGSEADGKPEARNHAARRTAEAGR